MKKKLKQYYEQALLLESLKESIETLKEAQASLAREIITQVMDSPKLCNIACHKRRWKGCDGRFFFSIELASKLVRYSSSGNGDMDDQDWLEKVAADLGGVYVRKRLTLNKRGITAAFAAGELDDKKLSSVKLRYEAEPSLTVKRLLSEEETKVLIEEASAAASDAE